MIKRRFMAVILLIFGTWASATWAADGLLSAGDMIKVSVFGSPEMTLETRIADGGRISFPLLGEVVIGGLTPSAAERKIAGLLESGKFLRNAQVNILVTLMQSQQVSVLGQVKTPGRYPLDGTSNLADLIALAGGMTTDSSDDVTLIHYRDGIQSKESVNLTEMLRGNIPESSAVVNSGSIVFVERAPRFYIYGEVQKPGSYRLERNMIVLQALSLGGGLTPRGTERGIRIKRRNAKGVLEVIDARQDDIIKVDDVVFVKESLF
ncbi:MAG: polysaccharide export protein EpsE [Pseudomonadota bacterium]